MNVAQISREGAFRLDLNFEGSGRQRKHAPYYDTLARVEMEVNAWGGILKIPEISDRDRVVRSCCESMTRMKGELSEAQVPGFFSSENSRNGRSQRKEWQQLIDVLVAKVESQLALASAPVQNPVLNMVVFEGVHLGYRCFGCDADPIQGHRFECQSCSEMSFCGGCFAQHSPSHPLILHRQPVVQERPVDEKYEIQSIARKRVNADGTIEFLVRWAGPWRDTWDSAQELGVEELVLLAMMPKRKRQGQNEKKKK